MLQFDVFKKTNKVTFVPRFTRLVHPPTIPVSDPAKFYAVNLLMHSAKILSAIKEFNIDLIFGSNLAICSLGFQAAKLYGVKRIFDLSDYFPDSAKAYVSSNKRWLSKGVSLFANFCTTTNIRSANVCTACSYALKDYAEKVSPTTQTELLPNGVDTETFIPKPPDKHLRDSFEIGDNTLVYVGSIESWMDFNTVFKALSLLKKDGLEMQLLIIGRSLYSEADNPLTKSIRRFDLSKQVKYLGFKPYEQVPDFISLGIGGLLPFRQDLLLTQFAFPNKLVEYLACGKPVFAPPMSPLRKVGGQYLFEYHSPEMLAHQIKSSLKLDHDPQEIRKSVLQYDWTKIAGKLERIMLNQINGATVNFSGFTET